MNAETERHLLDINHSFYDRFARPFADSRSTGQASLRRVLSAIADGAAVLDVGCGDGRVARALDEMGRSLSYVGVDASASFVALARERATGLTHVAASFDLADVTQAGWLDTMPQRSFDCVLALAVLHHIPGEDLRRRIVSDMASLVTVDGRLVVSAWQFLSSERLRRRITPWATVELGDGQVDAGDYLLTWERGGHGLRFCHLIGENEMRELYQNADLTVKECFLADNGLNLYAVGGHR